jgi:hypothetical protein
MPTQEVSPKSIDTSKSIIPLQKSRKRKFLFCKILLIFFFVILLIAISSAAVFFFLSSRKCLKDKNVCEEKLVSAITETSDKEENKDESSNGDEAKDCPECICECPDCVCPSSEGERCNITFTAEENLMMEGWVKYTNNTYHYSFMHPDGWMIMDTYTESLEAGESLYFEFFVLAGDTLNDDIIPDYPFSVEDGYVKEVYCTKAYQLRVSQPPPNEWEGVATYIIYDEIPYLTWVRFKGEGASVMADTIELYDLILKTFEFE